MRVVPLVLFVFFLFASTAIAKTIEQCEPEEEYICRNSCPPQTCISLVARFRCDSTEECKWDCWCKPGYLRRNKDSPCKPVKECPEVANSPDFN